MHTTHRHIQSSPLVVCHSVVQVLLVRLLHSMCNHHVPPHRNMLRSPPIVISSDQFLTSYDWHDFRKAPTPAVSSLDIILQRWAMASAQYVPRTSHSPPTCTRNPPFGNLHDNKKLCSADLISNYIHNITYLLILARA